MAASADIVVLMDESGSMAGEQNWIPGTIGTLDTGLNTAGLTGNRYGLVGFGASAAPAPSRVRSFPVGGGEFGTPAQFATAGAGLQVTGATEDGYAAIAAANSYSFASGVARNFILVTDEDRDNTNAALTFASVLQSLTSTKTLLNAVVNASFRCGDSSVALGIIGSTGYKANGTGGFTTCSGASFVSGWGSTIADYVDLALDSGGGAWDLNILRSGGTNAESFTNAFIAGKVEEIVTQVPGIPEPETYALMLAGLGAVGWAARRRKGRGQPA
jgi:hypothetical protein